MRATGKTPFWILGGLFWLGINPPLTAHPHVWTENRAEIVIQDNYIAGVWAEWTFDEVFSSLVASDFDRDANQTLDPTESAQIQKRYFDNLKNYQYFCHLYLGKTPLPVRTVNQFQARLTIEGRLVYRFFIPIGQRLSPATPFSVTFYDDTFFTDMVFHSDSPIKLLLTGAGKPSFSLRKNPERAFYGGQIIPVEAVIRGGAP